MPVRTSSMTVGSRSRNTARGTCFPAPVSLKNVLKASSPPVTVLSHGIWPSGCSTQRKNSSQSLSNETVFPLAVLAKLNRGANLRRFMGAEVII